jgi:hypothetical protein
MIFSHWAKKPLGLYRPWLELWVRCHWDCLPRGLATHVAEPPVLPPLRSLCTKLHPMVFAPTRLDPEIQFAAICLLCYHLLVVPWSTHSAREWSLFQINKFPAINNTNMMDAQIYEVGGWFPTRMPSSVIMSSTCTAFCQWCHELFDIMSILRFKDCISRPAIYKCSVNNPLKFLL